MELKILVDHAVRILLYLAEQKYSVPSKEIAEQLHISQSYVCKIIEILQEEKVVTVYTEAKGSTELKKKPDTITLLEIIEMMEQKMKIPRHSMEKISGRQYAPILRQIGGDYDGVQKTLDNMLKEVTIQDLLDMEYPCSL
ncbi:RrF2 family transcriptional regulator [Mediterraneibacter massiliensis]|uniref:RrF2 family transcriptional regulator n=1 Tax=Mediterraneibacter massiliensis TaxID=1720300 RepID=UPI000E4E23DB|nr:Rrf2 family transcriptional regulator [Mediterraneibacter massiliensis]RGT72413.1 transcriptional regulator [Ruminococcus sp. AF18-22]